MQGSFKCGHNRTAENSYVSSGTARCMTCHKAAVKKYDTPLSREKKTAADKKRRLENTAKHMIQAHKLSAKKRGLEFSITESDLLPLPEVCPVLGLVLDYQATGGKNNACSASIDRKENSLGYIPGNVAVISHRANTLKRDATLEEMRGVLSYMERAVTDYEL